MQCRNMNINIHEFGKIEESSRNLNVKIFEVRYYFLQK